MEPGNPKNGILFYLLFTVMKPQQRIKQLEAQIISYKGFLEEFPIENTYQDSQAIQDEIQRLKIEINGLWLREGELQFEEVEIMSSINNEKEERTLLIDKILNT